MISTPTIHTSSTRHRQIGRKVLQADRLARALNTPSAKHRKSLWGRLPSIQPKVLAAICAISLIVGIIGVAGARVYMAQIANSERAAIAEQQRQTRAKDVAASACRQKKAEQKADQLGKVTYDELYDYDECDK